MKNWEIKVGLPTKLGFLGDLTSIHEEPDVGEIHGTPGTVSKILWHFTGGPLWDSEKAWQGRERKPASMAYESLLGILRSRTLQVSKYAELVRIYEARGPIEDHMATETTISTKPVCCLADIPVMHLNYHANRYGKFCIGFHRNAILKFEFSPVFYQPRNSFLLQRIRETALNLQSNNVGSLSEILGKILARDDVVMTPDADKKACISIVQTLNEMAKEASGAIRDLMSFVKTFYSSEFASVYCEREWRSLKDFNFSYADVAMIILPRKEEGIEYFQRFVDADVLAEDIALPRSISVVAWEDLIEH
jgi:hypothetical protein